MHNYNGRVWDLSIKKDNRFFPDFSLPAPPPYRKVHFASGRMRQ